MTNQEKEIIAKEIRRLSFLYGSGTDKDGKEKTSQNRVANKAGISGATITQILKGNWVSISDEMWNRTKVKLRLELNWKTAQTTNYNYIMDMLAKAKEKSLSIGFSYNAGSGKSHAYKAFESETKNVIYIECKTYWSKKSYSVALAIACGLDDQGNTELNIEKVIDYLAGKEKPLLIIDQLDKLKDASMDLFMDFYNDLNTHCGFVLSGVPALAKRFKRGCKNDKTGYAESYSRIGRRWLELKPLTLNDVEAICAANGLKDVEKIKEIYKGCQDDLRRVKREIEKHYILNENEDGN